MTPNGLRFTHPEDFASVKGRGNCYYCNLCTPAGRPQGQALSFSAALRHEAENAKHRSKAEAAHPVVVDAQDDDWGYQPNCDWEPTPIPEGSSAWEEAYPCDRVHRFIPWWREGVAIAMRGGKKEPMDAFIERYNRGAWNKDVKERGASD